MAREKDGFRENLEYFRGLAVERLGEEKPTLNKTDVARLTGKNPKTVRKHYIFNSRGEITLPDLVRQERR